MEHQKNDNLNMLEAVVQNTEMGKNTLAQILPMAGDARFKAELIRQRSGYQELNQEAHAGLDACGSQAQGQSAFAKMNTKMGKNTLAQILPMAGDARFKAELIRQRSGYQELNQEAHAGLDACGSRAQGQSGL